MRTPVHWKRNVTMIIRHGLSQFVTAVNSDNTKANARLLFASCSLNQESCDWASLGPTQRQFPSRRLFGLMGLLPSSVSASAEMHGLRSASSDGGESPYSVRKACIGSIRDALQAGTRQASAATRSSVAATAAKIAGSSGRVP